MSDPFGEAMNEDEEKVVCRHCHVRWAFPPRSVCPTCMGSEDIAPDPELLKAFKHNQTTATYPLSAASDSEERCTCESKMSPECEGTFKPWKNANQIARKICKTCSRAKRSETCKKTAEIVKMLKESRGKVEGLTTSGGPNMTTHEIKSCSPRPEEPANENPIICVDFTGRELLLTKLKRIAFNSIRSPEEMLLRLVDECEEAEECEP